MNDFKPKLQNRAGYRLNKLKEDTHVSLWTDPRGPGFGEVSRGTVVSHIGDTISIDWYDPGDHEPPGRWSSGDLKYRIERGQAVVKAPPKERRLRVPASELRCKTCGAPRSDNCDCPRQGATKPEDWGRQIEDKKRLTSVMSDDTMEISNRGNDPDRMMKMKGHMMATKAPKAEVLEELEELDDAVDSTTEGNDGDDGLTAKQAATMLGTDAKTLRKFLRSKNGTIGQGKRWAIAEDDIPALKADFEAWGTGKRKSEPKAEGTTPPAAKKKGSKVTTPPADDDDEIDDISGNISDDELYGPEPTADAIEELDLLDDDEVDDLEFEG